MRAASWIVLLAALVAGRTALADDRLRVGTPEPTAFVFAAVDVGIDSGIFAKYGLTIERIDFAGGAKLHQAMAAGALDIIVGTGSDLLFLVRGAPERGVGAHRGDRVGDERERGDHRATFRRTWTAPWPRRQGPRHRCGQD